MTPDMWLTAGTVLATLLVLASGRGAPDSVLMGALTLLLLTGVLAPAQAFAGFGNAGLVTVAALFVVSAGLVDTGAVYAISSRLLGKPASLLRAQLRMMLPVTLVSGFLNNTPVVAMMVPTVAEWARRCGWPVSKLMLPLSYAAILGGTCTLIGTSTNVIVAGLVLSSTALEPFGFFDIAAVGVPVAMVGTAFILATSRWLLPDRTPPLSDRAAVREYAIEMLVDARSPICGQTIEEAGLRNLPGAYLAEITRAATVIPAVTPNEIIQAGDRMLFVGNVITLTDLLRMRGLLPAPEQLFELDTPRAERSLVEAVLSEQSPAAGKTIRSSGFRGCYDAVILAVARDGERLTGRLGDIRLLAGDTLLLEARPGFAEQQRLSRDFLLVSELNGARLPRYERAWLAASVLAAMVGIAATGLTSMLEAALAGAAGMILLRCTTAAAARRTIDWSLLLVIGASLGLGAAMESSGLAALVATHWLGLAGGNAWVALLLVYVLTSLLTELITNNAAAVLVFPFAEAIAATLGCSLWPFVIVIMMAASASFATPIGYQTNLMVYGPGGYRFTDYLRIGVPLNLVTGGVVVGLVPFIWPF